MIDWPKVVRDLEAENARLKKDLEQTQMALAIAYFDSVVEGKKQANALVAAAYSAAADAVNEVIPHNKYADQSYEYVAAIRKLTSADAEDALREFGVAVAKAIAADEDFKMTFEQIVDEVMEKNT